MNTELENACLVIATEIDKKNAAIIEAVDEYYGCGHNEEDIEAQMIYLKEIIILIQRKLNK